MATNEPTWPDPAEIAQAIRDGVDAALSRVIDADAVVGAIREGARLALDQVFGEQILDAIADGTKEAFEKK